MKEKISYDIDSRSLSKGDTIVIYSDGISEAMNNRKREFGDDRIKRVIKANLEKSSKKLIEILFSEVSKHFDGTPQNDDMTMIVVKRK
jgi:sigma-B regulation protein RsbU (phosphoserine phosphatase)